MQKKTLIKNKKKFHQNPAPHGLSKITNFLQIRGDNNWSLLKPVISIVRNLVQNAKECQAQIRGLGCIPRLINLVSFAKSYLSTKSVPEAPWSRNPKHIVRPEDIVIAACDALNLIAKDETNRHVLMQLNVVQILCEVLRHHVPNEAANILPQNRVYGLSLKAEAHLAEEVCTAAGHFLLTMRRDDQARELCVKYKVSNTLDQFQR